MHGVTLKFVNVQQAKPYNIYKNTKSKLLKTNAAVWFSKICQDRQMQPRKKVQRTAQHKGHHVHLLHVLLPQHRN